VSILFPFLEIPNIYDKDIPGMSGDTNDHSPRIIRLKRYFNFAPKLINIPVIILFFVTSTTFEVTF
jgi:hypothetical protein